MRGLLVIIIILAVGCINDRENTKVKKKISTCCEITIPHDRIEVSKVGSYYLGSAYSKNTVGYYFLLFKYKTDFEMVMIDNTLRWNSDQEINDLIYNTSVGLLKKNIQISQIHTSDTNISVVLLKHRTKEISRTVYFKNIYALSKLLSK
jgi:hypothetical protein